VHRGAGRTAGCRLRRSGRGGGQPAAGVICCGAVLATDRPRGAYPVELLGGVPVVGRRRGQVGRAVRRTVPLPVLVHHRGVHPVRFLVRSGVQPSGVQPSGVQPSGVRSPAPSSRPTCPAVWCRPSGGQLSGVRPSVLWRRSRPGSAHRSPWEHAGPAGAFTAGVDRVLCGLPGARAAQSTAAEAWTQATLRRSWVDRADRAARGSRTWTGSRSGCGAGRARLLTDQGDQPGLGAARRSG
jgi:hypothetical protein